MCQELFGLFLLENDQGISWIYFELMKDPFSLTSGQAILALDFPFVIQQEETVPPSLMEEPLEDDGAAELLGFEGLRPGILQSYADLGLVGAFPDEVLEASVSSGVLGLTQ